MIYRTLPLAHQKLSDEAELYLLEERHTQELYQVTSLNRDHLRRWLPWVESTVTPWDTRAFIQRGIRQLTENEGFNCGLWYQGRLVGVIGLHSLSLTHRFVSLGYWLARDAQGKGLMTLAAQALLDHAFYTLALNRLEIRCATNNARSCAVAVRLGFTHEGVIRQAEWLYDHFVDHNIFSMLAPEWAAKSPRP
ncbi:MAG: GNAT family N-acetyltransferase [Chloroflexi bacterium]|nr:GNAT family N-acetyltransferase [Chloroflexota bacterium]